MVQADVASGAPNGPAMYRKADSGMGLTVRAVIVAFHPAVPSNSAMSLGRPELSMTYIP